MNPNILRIIISLAAILIAAAHVVRPDIKIDSITLALFVVAIVPWLAPILKSVELPGGFKIELQDVQKATTAVIEGASPKSGRRLRFSLRPTAKSRDKMGLSMNAQSDTGVDTAVITRSKKAVANLKEVAESDPNLALVGFRIEIEKRLRELAKRNGIDDRRNLSFVLNHLQLREALPSTLLSALSDLIALGNKAAHGESVDPAVAPWIFDQGTTVLSVLDKFMARQTKSDRIR